MNMNSVQGNMSGFVEGYIPIWKRFTLKLGAKAGWQINPYLFRNELFRIGGLRTLRGFDEESIYSSMYAVGTFEFRFLLDEGSYVSIFSDAGYYERAIRNEYYSSYVVGFGAGITFATKIGLFTANYALGTQKDSPVDFRRSKIHFGYINYF
jgi:hemolysin activation/secretion protein